MLNGMLHEAANVSSHMILVWLTGSGQNMTRTDQFQIWIMCAFMSVYVDFCCWDDDEDHHGICDDKWLQCKCDQIEGAIASLRNIFIYKWKPNGLCISPFKLQFLVRNLFHLKYQCWLYCQSNPWWIDAFSCRWNCIN